LVIDVNLQEAGHGHLYKPWDDGMEKSQEKVQEKKAPPIKVGKMAHAWIGPRLQTVEVGGDQSLNLHFHSESVIILECL
jgi:CO dehydrogenase/acetyl-CoA synthase gamma subunit (corrinoid Fe-S protein)